ncbi:MAG: SulP family inorganic anion transporter [Nannocystaceae bacterium]|nr:SulP family inorganic anion transporter [Nannocystaceae bacterium]
MKRPTLPLPPLRKYPRSSLWPDISAATTVLFLAVPQSLAYATIAGLPPAMGLYAAAIPAIVGSLFRSSHHVLSGPTNAMSLLVGGATAVGMGADPAAVALTLALLVGIFQIVAGALRLGALVDYISSAVVLGYIIGAAVLIAVGQLHNFTGTTGPSGRIWVDIGGWLPKLGEADGLSLAIAGGTIATVLAARLLQRRMRRKIPGALLAIVLAIAADIAFDLESRGLRVIGDLAPIPSGFPPLTIPDVSHVSVLLSAAIACTVLSLVESNAVARSIAARTGQRIDASTEFFGQGLSNLAAAFFGGYPVSGSLARSAANEHAGARTRMAGVFGGLMILVVLLAFGSALDHTPVPSLAGLLIVVAVELVDIKRIKHTVRASPADGIAFVTTMVGTWVMSLDTAIYLGVGISLVLFLRNARLLSVRELLVGDDGALCEHLPGDTKASRSDVSRCNRIRFLHLDGSLFFGASGELADALDDVVADREIKVLVVRMKYTQGLDATSAAVFESTAARLHAQSRQLILVGMSAEMMGVLERAGTIERLGAENLFPARQRWLSALDAARSRAVALCGDDCATCPFARTQFAAKAEREPVPEPSPRT